MQFVIKTSSSDVHTRIDSDQQSPVRPTYTRSCLSPALIQIFYGGDGITLPEKSLKSGLSESWSPEALLR
jgi:hypothetical protein